jgi:hypothetical protein
MYSISNLLFHFELPICLLAQINISKISSVKQRITTAKKQLTSNFARNITYFKEKKHILLIKI